MSSRRRTASIAAATITALVLASLLGWMLAGRDEAVRTASTPSPSTPTPAAPETLPASSPSPGQTHPGAVSTPAPATSDDPASPDPVTGGGGTAPDPGAATGAEGRALTVTVAGFAADTLTVSGYLDAVETGGTCHLLLESGSTRTTADSPAVADATTTSCALDVPGERLANGTWTATLSYSSPTGAATSSPVSIEVTR